MSVVMVNRKDFGIGDRVKFCGSGCAWRYGVVVLVVESGRNPLIELRKVGVEGGRSRIDVRGVRKGRSYVIRVGGLLYWPMVNRIEKSEEVES